MKHLVDPLLEQSVVFLGWFWMFLPILAPFAVREPLCDLGIPSCALITLLMSGHSLKIEWFIANVRAVGSPYRAERDILGMALDVFGQFRLLLWSGNHFVI